MSEKVVITKEQAEAIERLQQYGFKNEAILEVKLYGGDHYIAGEYVKVHFYPIVKMDVEQLVKALYIGYEVEPKREELIVKQYKQAKENAKDEANLYKQYNQGMVDAIEMVLRTLKIEIEGIHK